MACFPLVSGAFSCKGLINKRKVKVVLRFGFLGFLENQKILDQSELKKRVFPSDEQIEKKKKKKFLYSYQMFIAIKGGNGLLACAFYAKTAVNT